MPETTTAYVVGQMVEARRSEESDWTRAEMLRIDPEDHTLTYLVLFNEGTPSRVWLSAANVRPVPQDNASETTVETIASLQDTVRRLESQLAEQTRLRDSAVREVQRWNDDVVTIAEALKDTANKSEWCDEYDRRARNLADRLTVAEDVFREHALREREWRVEVRLSPVYASVTASSAEEAESIVGDDPWSYIDRYDIDVEEIGDVEEE